ncbi:MAG: hypothetical protein AAF596_02575 [Planctomycetota bacterium]
MEPLKGVIHGTSIELTSDPGLPDGQQVEISVHVVSQPADKPGSALERISSYKGLEDWSEEDDRILAEIERSRRTSSRPLPSDDEDEAEE